MSWPYIAGSAGLSGYREHSAEEEHELERRWAERREEDRREREQYEWEEYQFHLELELRAWVDEVRLGSCGDS